MVTGRDVTLFESTTALAKMGAATLPGGSALARPRDCQAVRRSISFQSRRNGGLIARGLGTATLGQSIRRAERRWRIRAKGCVRDNEEGGLWKIQQFFI